MLLDVSAKRVVGVSQGLTEEVYLSILRPQAAAFHLPVRSSARTGEGEGKATPQEQSVARLGFKARTSRSCADKAQRPPAATSHLARTSSESLAVRLTAAPR